MFFPVVGLLVLFISCVQEAPKSTLLTEEYPKLYEAVFERNADSILTFTDHQREEVRAQAWRALINTPVQNIDDLITKAQYANTPESWMALSEHDLSDTQISRLHSLWDERSTLRKGISTVLGKQGNEESLRFLVRNFDSIVDAVHEYESALAISRLMMTYEMSEAAKNSILKYAAVLQEEKLFRAYFYGLYRGNIAIENRELQKAVRDAYNWVENSVIKQMVLRVSMNSNPEAMFNVLPNDDIRTMNTQLAVELAQMTPKMGWSPKLETVYNELLHHSNPVVNTVALNEIENHPEKEKNIDNVITKVIIENPQKSSSVRLSGILALDDANKFLELADSLSSENPYLKPKRLAVYQQALEPEAFLDLLAEMIRSENRMDVFHAAKALTTLWQNLGEGEKSIYTERVRTIAFDLLNKADRSITYVTVPFLESSGLIESEDFNKLKAFLEDYKLPGDVEVYQVFGALFQNHFPDRAQPLVDSLARQGNLALNRTFHEQGWTVLAVDNKPKAFRKPNWLRLNELGYEPIWVLETDKGTIKIKMDVKSAPVTIAGIDSLTQTGAYNEVAFHRVVPNFVIQGGDIETGDGFGGPDYVVPTEASAKEYNRGTVGIASAGTDTEGSQYFIMHQWKPHLNANYTIIGEVIEGMDIVDRIMVGDRVNKAYWQPRED